jgi:hypothetical protein
MSISYEFEGYYLPDWTDAGGLPVWVMGPCMNDKYKLLCIDNSGHFHFNRAMGHKSDISVSLRYSIIKDVIGEAPDESTHIRVFGPQDDGVILESFKLGKGYFCTNGCSRFYEIKGHLFDPEQYPKPVNLEEWKAQQEARE